MFNFVKKFLAVVSILAITISATGYGDNPIMAERAAKALCFRDAVQILHKQNIKPVRIVSKVVGEAGNGNFCLIKMEVE